MVDDDYKLALIEHYKKAFGGKINSKRWLKGPFFELTKDFSVLEFSPYGNRDMWVYSTVGMTHNTLANSPIELHICSGKEDFSIVELLTVVCHYHMTGDYLDLGHTVNFGRPWQSNSKCEYGYISLPYLYGPNLENFAFLNSTIKCYWLIPITHSELIFKKTYGSDALEDKFEENQFNYLASSRNSVV